MRANTNNTNICRGDCQLIVLLSRTKRLKGQQTQATQICRHEGLCVWYRYHACEPLGVDASVLAAAAAAAACHSTAAYATAAAAADSAAGAPV